MAYEDPDSLAILKKASIYEKYKVYTKNTKQHIIPHTRVD